MSERLDIELQQRLGRVDLDVRFSVSRETLALIGPSGAGKSSVLRVIAGLAAPDRGRIVSGSHTLLDTDARVDLPPEERDVGMVFQDGALFPHLSVAQNIAYGLRPRPRTRRERAQRVSDILERFAIAPLAAAKPGRVSGGERQRVALARAVAAAPEILLLDEPLSALDAVTKSRVAAELSLILADLRLPTILVSHDLEDVAGLADRVAVMDDGKIVQEGTTTELLQAPGSGFVAAFVGANFFSGYATHSGELTQIDLDGGGRVMSEGSADGHVGIVVQPWHVSLAPPGAFDPAVNVVTGLVTSIAPHGSRLRITVASTPPIVADVPAQAAWVSQLVPGDPVSAKWPYALTALVPDDPRGASG